MIGKGKTDGNNRLSEVEEFYQPSQPRPKSHNQMKSLHTGKIPLTDMIYSNALQISVVQQY